MSGVRHHYLKERKIGKEKAKQLANKITDEIYLHEGH